MHPTSPPRQALPCPTPCLLNPSSSTLVASCHTRLTPSSWRPVSPSRHAPIFTAEDTRIAQALLANTTRACHLEHRSTSHVVHGPSRVWTLSLFERTLTVYSFNQVSFCMFSSSPFALDLLLHGSISPFALGFTIEHHRTFLTPVVCVPDVAHLTTIQFQ